MRLNFARRGRPEQQQVGMTIFRILPAGIGGSAAQCRRHLPCASGWAGYPISLVAAAFFMLATLPGVAGPGGHHDRKCRPRDRHLPNHIPQSVVAARGNDPPRQSRDASSQRKSPAVPIPQRWSAEPRIRYSFGCCIPLCLNSTLGKLEVAIGSYHGGKHEPAGPRSPVVGGRP